MYDDFYDAPDTSTLVEAPPKSPVAWLLAVDWRDALTAVLLLLILASAYGLRSVGRNWDDYTHLHPDERFLTDVASRIGDSALSFPNELASQKARCELRYPAPTESELTGLPLEELEYRLSRAGRGGYFDAECSDLNPNNIGFGLYVYGEFPLFTTRITAETITEVNHDQCLQQAGGDEVKVLECQSQKRFSIWESYNGAHLVGRMMSSLADTLTTLLIFLIALKLLGRPQALLAAAFYAFAAFPIQQSHFWTVDAFTTTWVTLSIYMAVQVLDNQAARPARFAPLAWLAAAVAVWVVELERLDNPTIVPLVLYAAIFTLSAGGASLSVAYKDHRWTFLGGALGVALLAAALGTATITILGALAAVLLLLLLIIFTYMGMNRLGAYGGNWLWLMAAFSLWVYDGLAHYRAPSLLPLVIYLVIFTVGSLLASALYQAQTRRESVRWVLLLGVPLVVWAGIDAMAGAVSWEGMLWALFLTAIFSSSIAYGYRDFAAFGVAFGGALASRVNVAPIVGLLLLAVIIRSLPLLDVGLHRLQRYVLASRAMGGLMLAGMFTLLFFRLLQPHAFVGAYDLLPGLDKVGVLPVGLNEGWLEDIGEAQRLVSGQADIPPNHQWANRLPWIFPGQNIVLYGLGVALGVTAVLGLLWAFGVIIRGKPQWTRLALPVAWITVYFGWLGANWVTTMRYFLVLYGMLSLLAAWLLVEVVRWAWSAYQAQPQLSRRLVLVGANGILMVVLVYTMLYGYGMTAIHRHLLTRTAASLWFQQNVPGDIGVWVEREDGTYALQNLGTGVVSAPANTILLDEGESIAVPLTVPGDMVLQDVVLHRLTDRQRDGEAEMISVRVQKRTTSNVFPLVIAERVLEANVDEGFSDFGGEYYVAFDDAAPVILPLVDDLTGLNASYELEIKAVRGYIALSRSVVDNIMPSFPDHVTLRWLDGEGDPYVTSLKLDSTSSTMPPQTYYMPSQRGQMLFTANATGIVNQVEMPHLMDPLGDSDDETLRLEISAPDGQISYGGVTGNFLAAEDGIRTYGPSVTLQLDPPLEVVEGQNYTVSVVADAPLVTMGSVVATEGDWDDPIPYKVCPLPNDVQLTSNTPSGYTNPACLGIELYSSHYYGLELYLALEDDDLKRETLQAGLDQADYLTISSNRFYDTLSRIPYRWPMSEDYYKALFSGELGFELVYTFESYPRIEALGLEWKDQVLPTDDLPSWMNEFEAEEAFHVYDHPVVYVFRKTADYNPANTRAVLSTNTRQIKETYGGFTAEEVPVNRLVLIAPAASAIPTALMLTDSAWEAQQQNTWSELYDSPLNDNQWVAVAAWWLFMIALGWLVYPLLYAAFPGLPDAGFAAAKLIGLVLVAWLAWFGASLHLYTWNQTGIAVCMLLVGVVSLLFWLPRRQLFWEHLKEWRWYFLGVEILSLALYLFYVYVRYRNPDLWHNAFGGEKPMDFAYFNAVLRSRVFPPLDPWFAGGYINYYYWGFVLVGTPVKFLGIVPAVAYNLALPTMFSVTGMGAFAVAYNVVGSKRLFQNSRLPEANPWLAGIAALLLTVIVGNLDTVRVFTVEVAKMGGWVDAYNLTEERRQEMMDDFFLENGRSPSYDEQVEIDEKADNPPFYVSIQHKVTRWGDMVAGFSKGFQKLLQGERFAMATHRWYWAPTRIIAELPDGKGHNAINEMPYFTFLYGDLHAHMMAMPLMLLVMLWLAAEILGAGRGLRGVWAGGMALFIGGLAVGLLRATNTWDFPTFAILGVMGLTFVSWLVQRERMQYEGLPRPSIYDNLLAYMDLRRVWALWWLIFAFPTGIVLHGMIWLLRWRTYVSKLNAGLVPAQCQQISEIGLPNGVTLPEACEGMIEPQWHITDSLIWGFGMLLLTLILYWLALMLFGARFDRRATLDWLGRVVGFVGVALITVAPFAYWHVGEAGLKPWTSDRTPLWAYLDIHGLFIFILLSWLVWNTVRLFKRYRVADLYGLGVPTLLVLVGVPLTVLMALVVGLFIVPVMLVTLPMILWASGLFLMPGTSRMERFIYALMILALGLTTGVEIVVLNVDIGRQNMVFKFYMQAWLLFAVSSGVAVAWLLGSAPRWHPTWRAVWQMSLALLLTITLMYPIMATQARWLDRFDQTRTGNTLDGQAYMQYAVYGDNAVWYNLSGDYNMIQWINQNITGTPTIIEAQTVEYKWGSRIAINTGLPTVIGWNWHQRQQRNASTLNQLVWNRSNNVSAFYLTTRIDTAWNLIQFYGIEYIILGVQERVTYNDLLQSGINGATQSGLSLGLSKFDRMVELGLLEVVYEAPTCVTSVATSAEECPDGNLVTDKIYRVIPGAVYDAPLQVGG